VRVSDQIIYRRRNITNSTDGLDTSESQTRQDPLMVLVCVVAGGGGGEGDGERENARVCFRGRKGVVSNVRFSGEE